MRSAVAAVLAALVLAAPASAQRSAVPGWDEGVAALVPVEAFEDPGDRVWTDMRPLAFKNSDGILQAAGGATFYAGPSPQSAFEIEAWHARFVGGGSVDCEAEETLCMVRVEGRGGRGAFVFPVLANVHGLPASRLRAVPEVRVSDAQAEAALVDWLLEVLVLGDGNALRARNGARLVTSAPSRPDCGDPAVACGVVFEVETTVSARSLAVWLF